MVCLFPCLVLVCSLCFLFYFGISVLFPPMFHPSSLRALDLYLSPSLSFVPWRIIVVCGESGPL